MARIVTRWMPVGSRAAPRRGAAGTGGVRLAEILDLSKPRCPGAKLPNDLDEVRDVCFDEGKLSVAHFSSDVGHLDQLRVEMLTRRGVVVGSAWAVVDDAAPRTCSLHSENAQNPRRPRRGFCFGEEVWWTDGGFEVRAALSAVSEVLTSDCAQSSIACTRSISGSLRGSRFGGPEMRRNGTRHGMHTWWMRHRPLPAPRLVTSRSTYSRSALSSSLVSAS